MVVLGVGEPLGGPWRVLAVGEFASAVLATAGVDRDRPPIVAIDGRSAGGKSTLAARLQAALAGAAVVHTDDIAWWHSMFDWSQEMRAGVLEPLHRGQHVDYRPPGWESHGRLGAVSVPATASLVIIEGVGAGRRETADLIDAIAWVQTDLEVTRRRDADRVLRGETSAELVERWMQQEVPFLERQRPWERSFMTVAGASDVVHEPSSEVVVAPPLR